MTARRVIVALALLTSAAPACLRGQDLEMHRHPSGPPLPQAYYDRIRQNPDFFEYPGGWATRLSASQAANRALEGTINMLVVQVLFADSPEPHVPVAEVRRVLFDGPTEVGTFTDFYREVSRGKLTVTGFVTPWVRSSLTRAEVLGDNYGLGATARTGQFLHEALTAVDAMIDLGQFDNSGPDGIPNSGDDDGVIDVLAFQFLEVAASCGGNGIWPHRAGLSAWGYPFESAHAKTPSGQPIRANGYIVQSTVDCDGGPPNPSTIAHEFGHVLGMPDFYHAAEGLLPSQRRWVLGCWSLMAAGGWGCGDGAAWPTARRPSHMGAFEKLAFGWALPVQVPLVHDREYVLRPAQTSGDLLIVPLGGAEALYLEYRPTIGFDSDLPAGGVLIYHVDRARPLYPPAGAPPIYMLSLVEADGDGALLRTAEQGGDRGVAGDVWGIAGRTQLSAITTPALVRKNGERSAVTVHSITVADGVARVRLSTAPVPRLVSGAVPPVTALGALSYEVRATGGVLPYSWTLQDSLPAGVRGVAGPESLMLSGSPLIVGAFNVAVRIADALGTAVTQTLSFTIDAPSLAIERLLAPFLQTGAAPLSALEAELLDRSGNGNGRYDIGDLRKYLLSQGL